MLLPIQRRDLRWRITHRLVHSTNRSHYAGASQLHNGTVLDCHYSLYNTMNLRVYHERTLLRRARNSDHKQKSCNSARQIIYNSHAVVQLDSITVSGVWRATPFCSERYGLLQSYRLFSLNCAVAYALSVLQRELKQNID